MLTHEVLEATLNDALDQIQALPSVLAPVVHLRKEELA
jgi:homoserine dehydrogenase